MEALIVGGAATVFSVRRVTTPNCPPPEPRSAHNRSLVRVDHFSARRARPRAATTGRTSARISARGSRARHRAPAPRSRRSARTRRRSSRPWARARRRSAPSRAPAPTVTMPRRRARLVHGRDVDQDAGRRRPAGEAMPTAPDAQLHTRARARTRSRRPPAPRWRTARSRRPPARTRAICGRRRLVVAPSGLQQSTPCIEGANLSAGAKLAHWRVWSIWNKNRQGPRDRRARGRSARRRRTSQLSMRGSRAADDRGGFERGRLHRLHRGVYAVGHTC